MKETIVTFVDELRERVVGKRVVSVSESGSELRLDDGTTLLLYMSDSDCCASAFGNWVIDQDRLDAIITNVTIGGPEFTDDGDGGYSECTITILHNQNPVAFGECYADNGNGGYYYSILSLKVTSPFAEPLDDVVLQSWGGQVDVC